MITHHPVMMPEVLRWLAPRAGGVYLDGTVGGGGHAEAILEASAPDGILYAIDRDAAALERASRRLARFGERVILRQGVASEMGGVVAREDRGRPDGVLLDLGVSSFQLEEPARGFSFMRDGPLDMRMDSGAALTADEIVNQWSEADLATVIWRFGEERASRRIARAIVAARPIRGTRQLATVVQSVLGRKHRRIHPATKTFQAIRIAVNHELEEVDAAVDSALEVVAERGRVVVISFHSLEDRLVKTAFRRACGVGTPRDEYGHPILAPRFSPLTRRVVRGADNDPHPRARSARLRAVQRRGHEHRGSGSHKDSHRPKNAESRSGER